MFFVSVNVEAKQLFLFTENFSSDGLNENIKYEAVIMLSSDYVADNYNKSISKIRNINKDYFEHKKMSTKTKLIFQI